MSIPHTIRQALAPSAMRTPNSRLRWATRNETTACVPEYAKSRPTMPSNDAVTEKARNIHNGERPRSFASGAAETASLARPSFTAVVTADRSASTSSVRARTSNDMSVRACSVCREIDAAGIDPVEDRAAGHVLRHADDLHAATWQSPVGTSLGNRGKVERLPERVEPRPQCRRRRFADERHRRSRGGFSGRKRAPAHDLNVEHREVLGRHARVADTLRDARGRRRHPCRGQRSIQQRRFPRHRDLLDRSVGRQACRNRGSHHRIDRGSATPARS